ncbi:MAG: cytochrome c oxidase subunit II [Candidatus Tyrphobacter sp.]
MERAEYTGPNRGFWVATAILAVIALGGILYFWLIPTVEPWLPPEAGHPGDQVDWLFRFMASSAAVLYTFVVGYIVYFAIAYRRRRGEPDDALGADIHDNAKLEAAWTIGPLLFVLLLSIICIRIWWILEKQPANGLVVESIGRQWYFTFRYPNVNGEITDAMHLPVNVPVTLNLTSQDVIHSFWVPDMRLKEDMIPGLINAIRFTPTRVGTYKIICTEFCGTDHSLMDKQVMVVQPMAQYQAWYHGWQLRNAHASNAIPTVTSGAISLAGGNVAAGKALFSQKCSACHALAPFNQRIVGPGLLGVLHDPTHPNLVDGDPATTANAAKILQNGYTGSIGHMPNQAQNGLSNTDIANVVAYLNTLRNP